MAMLQSLIFLWTNVTKRDVPHEWLRVQLVQDRLRSRWTQTERLPALCSCCRARFVAKVNAKPLSLLFQF